MLFTELRVMRGPNMWSSIHPELIAIRFEQHNLNELSTYKQIAIKAYFFKNYDMPPFSEKLDHCINNYVVRLAARLQGETIFCELRFTPKQICYGLVEYQYEDVGKVAIELAVNIVTAIINNEHPLPLPVAYEQIKALKISCAPGPSTCIILNAATERCIPISAGPAGYFILGYGKKQKRLSAAISHYTSSIAVSIACNKEDTKAFLKCAHLPVAAGLLVREEKELLSVVQQLGFPLVAKPVNGNHGRNITCKIADYESLLKGFRYAKEISNSVIIERHIEGHDHRLLIVGNKFIAGALRQPPFVTGNGNSSIWQLVEEENSDPRRGEGHENILTKIKIDADTELCLQKKGLSLQTIPTAGEKIILKSTANLSTGGTAEDVTHLVHPNNILIAEKAAKMIGLDICGIDVMSQDITKPFSENGAAIIEVNAAPGLRMHMYPNKGFPQNVGEPIIDLMFEKGDEGRVPIVAITGTNGKTTTTRLMAHVASCGGNTVGFTTTDGIYIDGKAIQLGDCSGPQSARTVLQDPTVDLVVLECARGGIIRSGLAFDKCDIAIVTNVAADHLGQKDIYTVDDLAKVKAVVPCSVKKDGWAILNAEDEHALAMKNLVKCKVALFCVEEENCHLQDFLKEGKFVAFADIKQDIYICQGNTKIFIVNAAEVPITKNGKAGFMIENILPVILAAFFSGMDATQIAAALKSFIPSAEQTPGRLTEFTINDVNVVVDYAHNPHGLKALSDYLKNIPERKLGIITGTGDRREDDIIEFGRIAAAMYDDIIIRFDRDTRGRSRESIVQLLETGMLQIKPALRYKVISDTKTAIAYAIENVSKNSYVVICADNAMYTVNLVKEIALNYQS